MAKPRFEIDSDGIPHLNGEPLSPLDLSSGGLALTVGGYLETRNGAYSKTSQLTPEERAEIARFVIGEWLDWVANGPKR